MSDSKTRVADVGQQAVKLEWVGHLCRISEEWWVKSTIEWIPKHRKRPRVRPEQRKAITKRASKRRSQRQNREVWKEEWEAFD